MLQNAPTIPAINDVRPLLAGEEVSARSVLRRIRKRINFDDYVIGVGTTNDNGRFQPLRCNTSLPADVIEKYAALASKDIAAQLFVHSSWNVLLVDIQKFIDTATDDDSRVVIGTTLSGLGITELLVSGLKSSMGVVWLTLYRKGAKFELDQVELAGYLIRAALFDWQLRNHNGAPRDIPRQRYEFLNLKPDVLDVAIFSAWGMQDKQIAYFLGMKKHQVERAQKEVKREYASKHLLANRLFDPLPRLKKKDG